MVTGFDAVEFARLAEALHAAPTPEETAEGIVDYVCAQLDATLVGITLIGAGARLETVVATGPTVEWADRWQNELGEGPCRDSSWHHSTLTSANLADDGRWPRWAAKVRDLGLVSLLAAELTTIEDRRIGAVNIYWTWPRDITADEIAFANIFARHAALALTQAHKAANLNTALDTRKLIGQAQGILMERHQLDEAQAFEVLRRYSQQHNLKLRHVAANLIATRQLPETSATNRSTAMETTG